MVSTWLLLLAAAQVWAMVHSRQIIDLTNTTQAQEAENYLLSLLAMLHKPFGLPLQLETDWSSMD